jgi:hypothetical protein
VPRALAIGETHPPAVAQRPMPRRSHWEDPLPARATAARLACRPNSTSHRGLRSARDGGQAPRRDSSPPLPALGAGTATLRDALVGSQGLFFEFFQNGGRTAVQHAGGIANAAGMQGHLANLLLHLRGLSRVALLQEQRPPASQATRPASVPLLACSGHAMAPNIRPVAGGTRQHVRHHGIPIHGGRSHPPTEDTSSTEVKHLLVVKGIVWLARFMHLCSAPSQGREQCSTYRKARCADMPSPESGSFSFWYTALSDHCQWRRWLRKN